MSICTGPYYTCPSVEKRYAITGWTKTSEHNQNKSIRIELHVGDQIVPVNIRTRDYKYFDYLNVDRNNFKYIYSATIQNHIAECYDYVETTRSSIDEDYTTTDCELYYVDLRYDSVVYKETQSNMKFTKESNERINARTAYDDALLYPYIIEDVPISRVSMIWSTILGQLHGANEDTGYADGIRILMPLFSGPTAPYGTFVYEGVEYDAAVVDWYWLDNHRAADGDEFFWWADWHKAVGVYTELDAIEAINMWQFILGAKNGRVESVINGSVYRTDTFFGSLAHGKNDEIFLSAVFNSGTIKLAYLSVDTTMSTAGDDAWFPIAPL